MLTNEDMSSISIRQLHKQRYHNYNKIIKLNRGNEKYPKKGESKGTM